MQSDSSGGDLSDDQLAFIRKEQDPLYIPYLDEWPPSPYFHLAYLASGGDVTRYHAVRWMPVLLVCAYADTYLKRERQRAEGAGALASALGPVAGLLG